MTPSLSPIEDPTAPRAPDGSRLALVTGLALSSLAALQLAISRGLPAPAVDSLLVISPPSWHHALSNLTNGFHPDVNPDDRPTLVFLFLQVLGWIAMAGAAWHLLRCPASPRVLVILLAFAVVLRAILIPSVPLHDAMASRGLWEGKAMASGVNPYRYEPGSLAAHDLGLQEPTPIDGAVYRGRPWTAEDTARIDVLRSLREASPGDFASLPDPHRPTAFGPLVQVAFALSASMFGSSLLAWKSIVVTFDLGSLILLLRLLGRLGFHRSGILLYAWSPLILTEFAHVGRPDAIPIFLVLLTISLALPGRPAAAAAVLGLAALANPLTLTLAPVLLRSVRRPIVPILVLIGILGAGLTPFARWQDAGIAPLLRGANPWAGSEPGAGVPLGGAPLLLEAGIASVLEAPALPFTSPTAATSPVSPEALAPFLARIILAAIAVFLLMRHTLPSASDPRNLFLRMFRILGVFFVLAPNTEPWRLAWIVPFLAAFPRPSWCLLTLTVQAWFLQFSTDMRATFGTAAALPGLTAVIWLPFLALRFADSRLLRQRRSPGRASR